MMSAAQVQNQIIAPQCHDATWSRDDEGTFWLASTHREVLKSRDFVRWERVVKDFSSPETKAGIFETNKLLKQGTVPTKTGD